MIKKNVKKLEIDQSVRIEELNKDTILGVVNDRVSFVSVIPKKVKHIMYERFCRHGIKNL